MIRRSLGFWPSFCPAHLLSLDVFVSITCLPKNLIVVHMYFHERNLNPMFLHICRNSVKLH